MDSKADFFQKKASNTRSFTRQKQRSRKWLWWIVVIVLMLLWLICWKFLVNHDWENINNFDFSLGEEVHLQWEIKIDGDITHPYTIDDINYWEIWIKSDSINLSDYVWFVELTWIVEKFYQWNPIVKVISLSGSLSESWHLNVDLNDDWWVYIVWAWVQFLPSFFDEYVLLNEWDNWEIHIQNIESGKEYVLNYFRCNSSDPSKNCKWLIESFVNNSAQSFETSEWDVYYKNNDTQWFVANGNRWGIFINNVSDEIVFDLKDLIKFANEKNVNEWIKSRAINICQWSWEKLQKINNSEITLKQEWLVVTVSWDWQQKQMTCQILVDFGLPAKWKLQNLVLWGEVVPLTWDNVQQDQEQDNNIESTNEISSISDNSKFDTNVAQFPIKEEWLKYSSSRWGYTLQFPSSNISYNASSVKENFWRNDISCSYVINVIKYSEKENLEISPAIRIYECSGKVSKSWAPDILVYPRSGKIFVVKMNDWSWYDFSMHLKFEPLTE